MHRSEFYVLSTVLQDKQLVIRLSELRREHGSQQRQIGLVAYGHRIVAQVELVDEHPRGADVSVGLGLSRVVGVAAVVDHASVQVDVGARQQLQVFTESELIVKGVAPRNHARVHLTVPGRVPGLRGHHLQEVLARYLPVHQPGHAHPFVHEPQFGSLVFQWGKIRLQHVVESRAEQGAPQDVPPFGAFRTGSRCGNRRGVQAVLPGLCVQGRNQ